MVPKITLRVITCLLTFTFIAEAAQTSALSDDRGAIERLFRQYAKAISDESLSEIGALYDGDPTVFGERLKTDWAPIFAMASHPHLNYALTLAGISGDRALVRQNFVIADRPSRLNGKLKPVSLGRGTLDFLLQRKGDGFLFTGNQWREVDIVQEIQESLRQENLSPAPKVLQLVMEVRGGQWLPLRAMRWAGSFAAPHTTQATDSQGDLATMLDATIRDQSTRNEPGNLHLFMQWNGTAWSVAGTAWQKLSLAKAGTRPNTDASAGVGDSAESSLEAEARQMRQSVENQFGNAQLHRDYSRLLSQLGLYAKALDELQKASGLDPNLVPDAEVKGARDQAEQDPQRVSQRQLLFEMAVGEAPDHPRLLLQKPFDPQDPVAAFQRALTFTQLGDDRSATEELNRAVALSQNRRSATQQQILDTLSKTVQRRLQEAQLKPPNLLESSLFTVRFRAGDPTLPDLLTALEQAQHIIYAEFGIPMSHTEIVLFPTPAEFQVYSRECEAPISESTAAYTRGEEIITYAQIGPDTLSVVAHEYGHVAVNKMTNYNQVPKWLNEGIACCVQGGYWDYEKRCWDAFRTNRLLTIDQLIGWQFEGDSQQTYIAYSQANSMVQYLVSRFGRQPLLNLLSDIGRGLSADSAFRNNLGFNQTQLLIAWVTDTFSKNN